MRDRAGVMRRERMVLECMVEVWSEVLGVE